MKEEKLITFVDAEKPPLSEPSIIMVVGVGGAGGNAVNHMLDMGIENVKFMVCNTDRQALNRSRAVEKIQLGAGLGAGSKPEVGKSAAIDSINKVIEVFKKEGTKMVFITAGMGGGTGTGAAPIIAKAAQDMGILTVATVTMPYISEGPIRGGNAKKGVEELKKHVDSLLVISNENIQKIYGELPLSEAFGRANNILATAAKGVSETITKEGLVNVDYADVETVMKKSGMAIMGSAQTRGENRAMDAAKMALSSPLLNRNSVLGAEHILFNVSSGGGENEVTIDEAATILDYLSKETGSTANIIWGSNKDESLGDNLVLVLIATGFQSTDEDNVLSPLKPIGSRGAKTSWTPPIDPFKPNTADKGHSTTKIISLKTNKRYDDIISKVIDIPAYKRRNVNLSAYATADSSLQTSRLESQTQLEKEQEEQDKSQTQLF